MAFAKKAGAPWLLLSLVTFAILSTVSLHIARDHDLDPAASLVHNHEPAHVSEPSAFDATGLSVFLGIYERAAACQQQQLVLICTPTFGYCGGIADRLRGIPFVVSLALLMHRQLLVHESVLANGPLPPEMKQDNYFFLVDDDCAMDSKVFQRFLEATQSSGPVYVMTNCLPRRDLALAGSRHKGIDFEQNAARGMVSDNANHLEERLVSTIYDECHSDLYWCGAGVIHAAPAFVDKFAQVRHFVEGMVMLPLRNYTALHIRAGGSNISIGGSVNAVPWKDGYESNLPQLWIDSFRAASFKKCKHSIALITDSARVAAEIQFAAKDELDIIRCCGQPVHRDQLIREGFFFQEILDLYLLARAKWVVAGVGGFALLGQRWNGLPGPPITLAKSRQDIKKAMRRLFEASGCENIEIPD